MLNYQRRIRAHFADSAEESYTRIRERFAAPRPPASPTIPNLTAQLNELFAGWRVGYPACGGHFVADGNIGSDEDWWNAPLRVLLLAKEANDPGGMNHDLRKLFRNDSEEPGFQKKRFEYNVGRWAHGLHNRRSTGYLPPFDQASPPSTARRALRWSAVVNLKKAAGGGLAVSREIRRAATRDRSMILKQIEILNPNIVVFGRDKESSSLVQEIVGDLVPRCDHCYSRGSQYWIEHWHPSKQGDNDRDLYDGLSQTCRRLFQPAPRTY